MFKTRNQSNSLIFHTISKQSSTQNPALFLPSQPAVTNTINALSKGFHETVVFLNSPQSPTVKISVLILIHGITAGN